MLTSAIYLVIRVLLCIYLNRLMTTSNEVSTRIKNVTWVLETFLLVETN